MQGTLDLYRNYLSSEVAGSDTRQRLSEDIKEGAKELFLKYNPGAQTFATNVIKVSKPQRFTPNFVSLA